MPVQPRILRELSAGESLRLLATVSVGRVVFTDQALPAIRPVNHVIRDGDVVIRTHVGAKLLDAVSDSTVMAYQADAIDPMDHLGWSVIVTGIARLVTDSEAAGLDLGRLRPWVTNLAADHVIRIRAELVTGFELLAAESANS